MTSVANFSDEEYFPLYGTIADNTEGANHWCLFAEIVAFNQFLRPVLEVKDRVGKRFRIALYPQPSAPPTYDLSQFKKGHTVAVFYASEYQFLDGSEGVRQEDLSHIAVRVPSAWDHHLLLTCRPDIGLPHRPRRALSSE